MESKQGGETRSRVYQGESQRIDMNINSHSGNNENQDKNCTSIQIERVESKQV